MIRSLNVPEVFDAVSRARQNALSQSTVFVTVENEAIPIQTPFPSPIEWRDHVIYFLLVDRFNNPDETRNPAPFEEKTANRLGGTIKGITAKLDYVRNLGATAIWLSPVLRNTRDSIHGYSIQNFLAVDPRFGIDDDLIELVQQAHARNIYVILDIVINHAGNVFDYEGFGPKAPHLRDDQPPYEICWRTGDGNGACWNDAGSIPAAELTDDAAIFPDEMRRNDLFRRRGVSQEDEQQGDFETLKEFETEREQYADNRTYYPVRDLLIKAHEYLIAKFDIDGFRVDTIKHVEPEFSLIFGNAIREFAGTIGKKNFFTFGEAKTGDEKTLATYTGKFASDPGDLVGLDSTLDFPLMWKLQSVCKGFAAPSELAGLFERRKAILRGEDPENRKAVISSHGEASRFYVTKIDNHDEKKRFRYCPKENDINAPFAYDKQVSLALACLCSLIGIPSIYYGTEQGLRGDGDEDWYVREALWGKPGGGFDENNNFYRSLQSILGLRSMIPALRYGRQYFRAISGNGVDFGVSTFSRGVISFSRILHDTEIITVANTDLGSSVAVDVIVDFDLNQPGNALKVLYSNTGTAAISPDPVVQRQAGSVNIRELSGAITTGPIRTIRVSLQPGEVQLIGR
jgi:glycosidase